MYQLGKDPQEKNPKNQKFSTDDGYLYFPEDSSTDSTWSSYVYQHSLGLH